MTLVIELTNIVSSSLMYNYITNTDKLSVIVYYYTYSNVVMKTIIVN